MILAAVAIALILGTMQTPLVKYLRPIGDFYVALLQMCVLPFYWRQFRWQCVLR